MNDWAATSSILIDLERRRVFDVLDERSGDYVERWFKHHPEVETISRDRCGLMRAEPRLARPKPSKSPTGFIFWKICATASRSSWQFKCCLPPVLLAAQWR